jgi:hypothetical protein
LTSQKLRLASLPLLSARRKQVSARGSALRAPGRLIFYPKTRRLSIEFQKVKKGCDKGKIF